MIASEWEQYGRLRPTPLPTLELADVVRLLPRLRCGTCGSRVALHPPERCSLDRNACICERGYLYCPSCARVWNDVAHQVRPRVPLGPEEMRLRPGRPPTRLDRSCDDCGAPCRNTRCEGCAAAHLAQWPRLVAFLADGQPHKAAEILASLGISDASLRQYVCRARKAGHVIRTGLPFGTYRLEVEP